MEADLPIKSEILRLNQEISLISSLIHFRTSVFKGRVPIFLSPSSLEVSSEILMLVRDGRTIEYGTA